VDTNRLPPPPESAGDAASYVPPHNEYEQVLQGVWQQVLGLSQPPSVEADFFTELGGSSLQVMFDINYVYLMCHRVFGDAAPAATYG
jgi:hypothetical protein